jgi:hypothetical protein
VLFLQSEAVRKTLFFEKKKSLISSGIYKKTLFFYYKIKKIKIFNKKS